MSDDRRLDVSPDAQDDFVQPSPEPPRSLRALANLSRDADEASTAKPARPRKDADALDWRVSSDPRDAVADEALAAALPPSVRRGLMRGDPIAVVVAVPGPDWVLPITNSVLALSPDAYVFSRDGSQTRQHVPSIGNDKVANALSTGVPVVGVSPSPATLLPAALVAAADASVSVSTPDAAALRRALARCARRPVPNTIPASPCGSLSFDEIASAFRKDATGHDVVATLARMHARKTAPVDDGVPTLDRLPGISGDARAWAETLARDWSLWRSGRIADFGSLESSAMLYGAPGVGKTMLVRSLAKTLGVRLHCTSPGAWFTGPGNTGHLGDAATAFRRSWDAAVADARSGGGGSRSGGALWFLDEADGLMDRAHGQSSGNRDFWANLLSLINVALNEKVDGLCVVGATNAGSYAAPDTSIDGALRRRFGRTLVVQTTTSDLAEVVSFYLKGALSAADLLPVVRLASGASAATAANWARDALNRARDAGRPVAVDDVLAVLAPPDARPPSMVRRIALHEAAHVVVAHAFGHQIDCVTIVETASAGGLSRSGPEGAPITADEIDRIVTVGLAGRAAEEAFLGAPSGGAEGDLRDATAILAAAHASAGLGTSLLHRGPSAKAAKLLRKDPLLRDVVEAHLASLYREALALVARHRAAIERVADALMRRRMLTGDDVRAIAGDVQGGQP